MLDVPGLMNTKETKKLWSAVQLPLSVPPCIQCVAGAQKPLLWYILLADHANAAACGQC